MKRDEHDAEAPVAESRREVEARLAELKAAIGRETGMVPKASYAVLALVAAAAGFAVAARRRRKKRVGSSVS